MIDKNKKWTLAGCVMRETGNRWAAQVTEWHRRNWRSQGRVNGPVCREGEIKLQHWRSRMENSNIRQRGREHLIKTFVMQWTSNGEDDEGDVDECQQLT